MDDVAKLLLETIKPSLVELSERGIGAWNMMSDEGIYYIFNGKEYLISVKEVVERKE